jgi:multiple sugar transport system substrate-binding protein
MKELEFSTMYNTDSSGLGDSFFEPFVKRHLVNVKRLHMDWNDSWNLLVQFGLNSRGPDVSEVGTTWLGSFHTMDALRPLAMGETALLGGENDFPPALWQACKVEGENLLFGIPWTLDLRVVLYRRDWLQKAGVDEATAFADSGHFSETLSRLQAAGHPSPLGLTTTETHTRLSHDVACWVWSAGGNLRSDDGRRMMLMEPESRAGLEAYFGMKKFISLEMSGLTEIQVFEDFFAGKTAAAILPERAYLEVVTTTSNYVAPEVKENIGLAMLMQAPYIGGSALTIWRHSSDYQDSLKLIQHLTSLESWQALSKIYPPYPPARLDALDKSPLAQMPCYPAVRKSLQNGRCFHSGYRWRGVEARLVSVIEQMWSDLRANPELNIASEVEKRFSDLCIRLEQTILASSW